MPDGLDGRGHTAQCEGSEDGSGSGSGSGSGRGSGSDGGNDDDDSGGNDSGGSTLSRRDTAKLRAVAMSSSSVRVRPHLPEHGMLKQGGYVGRWVGTWVGGWVGG